MNLNVSLSGEIRMPEQVSVPVTAVVSKAACWGMSFAKWATGAHHANEQHTTRRHHHALRDVGDKQGRLLLVPVRVEGAVTVDALERMRAKVVTLCLREVGGQALPAESVKVLQRRAERRRRDARGHAQSNDAAPCGLRTATPNTPATRGTGRALGGRRGKGGKGGKRT